MNNKENLKKIAINFIAILTILLIIEFGALILKTRNDIEYDYKLHNKNLELKSPKLSLKYFVKYMFFNEMKMLYLYKSDNYFKQEEFRKPSVGKDYKNEDIIIAGCSFAHGASLNNNETISNILAKKFPKYKVYNIGLSGASPRENLFILRNSQKFKIGIFYQMKKRTQNFIFTSISKVKRKDYFCKMIVQIAPITKLKN